MRHLPLSIHPCVIYVYLYVHVYTIYACVIFFYSRHDLAIYSPGWPSIHSPACLRWQSAGIFRYMSPCLVSQNIVICTTLKPRELTILHDLIFYKTDIRHVSLVLQLFPNPQEHGGTTAHATKRPCEQAGLGEELGLGHDELKTKMEGGLCSRVRQWRAAVATNSNVPRRLAAGLAPSLWHYCEVEELLRRRTWWEGVGWLEFALDREPGLFSLFLFASQQPWGEQPLHHKCPCHDVLPY